MKSVILPVLVAMSTFLNAQQELIKDTFNLPNVSFICDSYDFFIPVMRPDSAWVEYDTSMENYPEAYDLERLRRDGGEMVRYKVYRNDSLIEHRDYMQTISIDFTSYTISYYSDEKFLVNNIVSVYEDPLALEPGKFVIFDQNEDESGYNSYEVDFENGSIVATDAYIEYLGEIGTLKLHVAHFIKY